MQGALSVRVQNHMDIELSEDLQYYKESFVLGLTVKQAIFSILALGTGTAIVLLLYNKIGITLSCYVATPFVVPLALTGFYNYHGLSFWQFASKLIRYSFFNRPLVYCSTESVAELKEIFLEDSQEKRIIQEKTAKEEKKNRITQRKTEKKTRKRKREEKKEKKKSKNGFKIMITAALLLAWGALAAAVYFYYFY